MRYYTIRQASRLWGVNRATVLIRIQKGRVKAVRLDSGMYLIHEREVKRWMGIRAPGGWPLGRKRKPVDT